MSDPNAFTPTDAARVLGVAPGASFDQRRAAFRVAAHAAHPDHGGSIDEFLRVVAAYHVLDRCSSRRSSGRVTTHQRSWSGRWRRTRRNVQALRTQAVRGRKHP